MISVFFTNTIKAKAWQTSTMTSIILASPCDDRETMQASSTYSIPYIVRRTWSIAGSGPIDVGDFFRGTSSARTSFSLNLWRTTVSTTAKNTLNNSLLHLPTQTDAVIKLHTSSLPIMDLLDDCYHMRWYSDASEYLPEEGAVNGIVHLLKIYEAHEERHFCLPPNFRQPASQTSCPWLSDPAETRTALPVTVPWPHSMR